MLEVCMRFPCVVNVRKAFPMDKVLDVIVLGTSRSDDPFDASSRSGRAGICEAGS
jgi:hypothetical protein